MKNILIFYHIPKCGGTLFWNHAIAYSMDIQNPNRNKYGLCFCTIKTEDSLFKIAFYTDKKNINKYLDQTIDSQIFENNCKNHCFIPYAIYIFSHSKFLDTRYYIENFSQNNKLNPIYITILRNPIDRIQSIFYYNTEFGWWENNYKFIKAISFDKYMYTDKFESNWMVNHINQNLDIYPNETHLKFAINTLDSFSVVGTLENINLFQENIKKYNILYRPINDPFYKYYPIEKAMNKNTKSIKINISKENMEYLKQKCKYDIGLYDYFYREAVD